MMADTLPATRSVWLVAGREFSSRARSRRVVLATAAVALLLVVFVLLQAFTFGRQQEVRIGLAGQAISLQQSLPQEMAALGAQVSVSPVDSVAEGVAEVRSGRLDVLVSGARSALRVTVANTLDPRLRATLNSQVRQQILDAQIAQLGARPDQVLGKVEQAQISLTQLRATDPARGQRTTLGVLTALLVAWSLFAFSALAAVRVTHDIRDGTAEALLPVLRPRRLLAGSLGGIGLTGLLHAAALGVLGTVLAVATGVAAVPSAVVVAFGSALAGFALGFGMYGVAAALGASLRRGRSAVNLVTVLGGGLAVVFVVAAVLFGADPGGGATAVLSVLPPFAPLLMPARLAAGVAGGWEVLLAVALMLLTCAGLAWLAARVYPRSVVGA
ncbi:MAG TPA: ABC transporter permease [Pseudonocardiaceae bacterium]|jgi:ABC-2 type transport system permease protein|nr:ABC transporter permease [Pseudonocardiaceae bacterium]